MEIIDIKPFTASEGSLTIHRKNDHFNGIQLVPREQQEPCLPRPTSKKYTYSSDELKSINSNSSNGSIPRKLRKKLFLYHLWRPSSGNIRPHFQDLGQPFYHYKGKSLINIKTDNWTLPTILTTNPRSLANKFDDFSQVVKQNHVEVAVISETWLSDRVHDGAVQLEGYTLHRKDRLTTVGGGVACYVSNQITHTRLDYLEHQDFEILWIKLQVLRSPKNYSPIIIGALYHTTNSNAQRNRETIRHLLECLDRVSMKHPYAGFFLTGDFNRLSTKQIEKAYKLHQIVKNPTRGNACLDLIITNMHNFYQPPIHLSPIGVADHQVIICKPLPSYRIPKAKRNIKHMRKFSLKKKIEFVDKMNMANWECVYKAPSCEEMYHNFSQLLITMVEKHFPWKMVSRGLNDKPWVTDHLRDTIRKRQIAWMSKDTLKYKFYRNRTQRLCKKLKSQFYISCIDDLKCSNPAKWWSGINKICGRKTSNDNLTGLANKITDGSINQLADQINSFFTSLSANLQPVSEGRIYNEDTSDYVISLESVQQCLSRICDRKAQGPDNLPSWILKDYSHLLKGPISAIFNASIRESFVPKLWKIAEVCAIP